MTMPAPTRLIWFPALVLERPLGMPTERGGPRPGPRCSTGPCRRPTAAERFEALDALLST
jgi:hypothetical protein